MLLDKISCPVLHHNTNPTWYEEIKIRLPLNISAHHHLLFSFVHVSCDMSKRRDEKTSYENPVGYSWIPMLSKGKINVEEQMLPVAAALPAGYLAIQPLGLGKGVGTFSILFIASIFISINHSNPIACHLLLTNQTNQFIYENFSFMLHILNFLSRMPARTYSGLTINVQSSRLCFGWNRQY